MRRKEWKDLKSQGLKLTRERFWGGFRFKKKKGMVEAKCLNFGWVTGSDIGEKIIPPVSRHKTKKTRNEKCRARQGIEKKVRRKQKDRASVGGKNRQMAQSENYITYNYSTSRVRKKKKSYSKEGGEKKKQGGPKWLLMKRHPCGGRKKKSKTGNPGENNEILNFWQAERDYEILEKCDLGVAGRSRGGGGVCLWFLWEQGHPGRRRKFTMSRNEWTTTFQAVNNGKTAENKAKALTVEELGGGAKWKRSKGANVTPVRQIL